MLLRKGQLGMVGTSTFLFIDLFCDNVISVQSVIRVDSHSSDHTAHRPG